jgi:predicted signal transduction protein with EAL and GGDEF domain
VQAIRQPYDLEGHGIDIGVSIGITLAPGDGIHSVQLLKNADLALYRAKENGRGCWHFFEPAMDALASARRAVELELRDATLLDQLELHYQPVVCSRGRTVTGFEALLRWRHPTRGMVPPAEFISVTEEIGLIVPIGAWVLNQACAEAAAWPNHLRVAVNLSPRQFRGQALVGTVADALRTSGLRPERLELEITESVLLQDDPATVSTLRALQAMGIRIALDDFGTGYSSLSYLLRFPFDTIKIDRSFVRELPTREDCATIVRAITGLGHSLHMHTTAEGVETEAQFEFLAAAGCTEIQGYLFSKPVTACAVPALIAVLSAQPGSAALAGAAD